MQLAYGTNGCPDGRDLLSATECQEALDFLGHTVALQTWSETVIPGGCSVRECAAYTPAANGCPSHDMAATGAFNTNRVGSGRSDLAPICLSRDRAADRDRTQEDPLEELCSFRGGLGNMALPIRLRARIPVFDGAELFI